MQAFFGAKISSVRLLVQIPGSAAKMSRVAFAPGDGVDAILPTSHVRLHSRLSRASESIRSMTTRSGSGRNFIRCNSIWSVIVPADGTRTATVGNGDFGKSPFLLGSSRTSRCSGAKNNGGSKNYVLI